MPSDRAGYTVSLYAIDVSPAMGEVSADPDKGVKRSKLEMVKEYVARALEPKISSGRKTEAAGVLSFGGRTNNQAHQAYTKEHPEEDDPPYLKVSSDVAIQTAKPKVVEEVMNLQVGNVEGNPVSALMVALDMIHVHKHTKSWALEVMLLTDGESEFDQGEYEDCMRRFEEMGVKLSVVGVGFDAPDVSVEKTKSRNKRLSEKFWRTFVKLLYEEVSKTTSAEELLPELLPFEPELARSRLPKPTTVNGTSSGIDLLIGSPDIDPEEAIRIPVKFSKATMRARPPTLSRAWKPAMDLQAPLQPSSQRPHLSSSSQLLSTFAQQSQQRVGPGQSDLASMISSDVKAYSTYVIKKAEPAAAPDPTQASQNQSSQMPLSSQAKGRGMGEDVEEDEGYPDEGQQEDEAEEEEAVAKEDIVKAWRFGSTWVPMEADTFEPLNTRKGVEILGFFPRSNLKRHHLMGEVRFVWPDMTSPKGQIQFSSFVTALILREMVAVVRWVLKDQSEPVIGICIPEQDFPDAGKRLDFMFWIKLPFAEDEHNFWFPSLTTYKTASGKVLKDHPLLPTDEQCELMEQFVQAMDLDEYAASGNTAGGAEGKEEGEEDDDEEMREEEEPPAPWFEALNSYNPAIHRIKEAIFHASLTYDLDKDPLGPPHPELTKYFNPPDELVEKAAPVVSRLKEALAVKKVPAKVRQQKRQKEGLREGEGYIDIDELFDEPQESKAGPSSQKIKAEPSTPRTGAAGGTSQDQIDDDGAGADPVQPSKSTPAKPKRGRLISNENPLDDFNRLIEGEGDVFRKAIQDLGAVVKENVEASFSKQAFPLAIKCLKAMRETALVYEEVETYNAYIEELEKFIKAPKFKHKDFWKACEDAGNAVTHITEEEEEAALKHDDE